MTLSNVLETIKNYKSISKRTKEYCIDFIDSIIEEMTPFQGNGFRISINNEDDDKYKDIKNNAFGQVCDNVVYISGCSIKFGFNYN